MTVRSLEKGFGVRFGSVREGTVRGWVALKEFRSIRPLENALKPNRGNRFRREERNEERSRCLCFHRGPIILGRYPDRGQTSSITSEASASRRVVIILMNFKQYRVLANQPYKLPSCASLIGHCDHLFATRDVPSKRNPRAIHDTRLPRPGRESVLLFLRFDRYKRFSRFRSTFGR